MSRDEDAVSLVISKINFIYTCGSHLHISKTLSVDKMPVTFTEFSTMKFIDFFLTENVADPNSNGLGLLWCCKFLQTVLHESRGKIGLMMH